MLQRRICCGASALAALSACLAGCADGGRHDGRAILRELERDGVTLARDDEAIAAPGAAELPATGPITLTDLLHLADEANPEIGAARSRVGVAAGQGWQSSLYPNPSVGVEVADMRIDDAPDGAQTTVGVTQPIVVGGRLNAARRGGEAGQRAATAAWASRRREVHGQIAMAAAEVASARELQSVYTGLRQLAEQSLTTARTRYEARAATETEVLRPQIDLYRIDASIDRARRDESAAVVRLGLLLGGAEVEVARLVDPFRDGAAVPSLAALQETVRSAHPSLIEAEARVEQAGARLEQIQAERTPDLDVSVGAGYDDAEGEPIVEFGAGMTLPLWDRRQGDILAARFEIAAARYERLGAENALLARLADAHAAFEAASAELGAVRQRIAPAAERALEQTSEGYRAGRAGFLEVVEAQRTVLESRVAIAELQAQAAEAWADIVQVVGIKHAGLGGDAADQEESSNKEIHQ
jgi:outer membrane protein, heavy metal efflux system